MNYFAFFNVFPSFSVMDGGNEATSLLDPLPALSTAVQEFRPLVIDCVVSSGTYYTYAPSTSVSVVGPIAIYNKGHTYLTATFRTAAQTGSNSMVYVPAGGFVVIPEIWAANNLVLASTDTTRMPAQIVVAGVES